MVGRIANPTYTIKIFRGWWYGSTVAESETFGELDDLHGAGIEIENASRGEYQIELQSKPVRFYRIGWKDRIRWENWVRR